MIFRQGAYDVAVVGAGPVGSVAAIAFARKGANVLLLEANPRAASRLAGEWLHPGGTEVLARLGVRLDLEGTCPEPGLGMVVFPDHDDDDDEGGPIPLPYAGESRGLMWEHRKLVEALRQQAISLEVDFAHECRVVSVDKNEIVCVNRGGHASSRVKAGLIVGADGRGSLVREKLGLGDRGLPLSHMAGLELKDVELPFEGYGHVILGGPGPVLLYRIGADSARMCFDIPTHWESRSNPRTPQAIWEHFGSKMPEALRPSIRAALEKERLMWAANGFRPRWGYGRDPLALVGEAVGYVHPLTAAGMSLGLLDAECLAQTRNVRDYEAIREAASYVPELLANAFYHVVLGEDPGARAIRNAMFREWRTNPKESRRNMEILACSETRGQTFFEAFLTVAGEALKLGFRSQRKASLGDIPRSVTSLLPWLEFPFAALLPKRARRLCRPKSTSLHPIRGALSKQSAQAAKATRRKKSQPPESPRPTPENIVSAEETTSIEDCMRFCTESLQEVSRTFARPIAMLEGDLRVAVMCGYLLCRIVDTVEDHPHASIRDRERLYDAFLGVLERGEDPARFAAIFSTLARKEHSDDRLAKELSRVMRVFRTLPVSAQQICSRWVAEMGRGMNLYSHRGGDGEGLIALKTLEDLERYCYFVAGTVGHMLTELFLTAMPDVSQARALAMRTHAESFGVGLQLVNILKDVTDDRERRWSFIPESACELQGITIAELTDPRHRAKAHAALAPIFERARRHLDRALIYSLSIPEAEKNIRLFCLLPLWMAITTLRHAQGNDAMFEPGHPVKISRAEVEDLIADCLAHWEDDDELRAQYKKLKEIGGKRVPAGGPGMQGTTEPN